MPNIAHTAKTAGLIDVLSLGSMGAALMGKQIPGVGTAISGLSAANRVGSGDLVGAGLDIGAAVASPFPGVGTAVSAGLGLVNLARDLTAPGKHQFYAEANTPVTDREQLRAEAANDRSMKRAHSQFQHDIENPNVTHGSDLYNTIRPMISSEGDASLRGKDKAHNTRLNDDVARGVVGLEYLTGLKKNTGETFYDKHPLEAVTTDASKHSLGLGAAAAAGLTGENLRRQWSNFHKTERAQMSRTGNPLDATNPANLLDPSHGPSQSRADISRIFGDLESNPEKRLDLIDSLTQRGADPESYGAKYRKIKADQAAHTDAYTKQVAEIEKQLAAGSAAGQPADKEFSRRLAELRKSHADAHGMTMAKSEGELKKLLVAAKNSKDHGGLQKYVNLHESMRRAGEQGGLKSYVGDRAGAFRPLGDLLEKYHITGSHSHFNSDLIKQIAEEHLGGRTTPAQAQAFLEEIMPHISDKGRQASGLRKLMSRMHVPLKAGVGVAAGVGGLHYLLKAMQNQSHSNQQLTDWKKTLLQSRGDFDGAKRLEQAQAAQQQQQQQQQNPAYV